MRLLRAKVQLSVPESAEEEMWNGIKSRLKYALRFRHLTVAYALSISRSPQILSREEMDKLAKSFSDVLETLERERFSQIRKWGGEVTAPSIADSDEYSIMFDLPEEELEVETHSETPEVSAKEREVAEILLSLQRGYSR